MIPNAESFMSLHVYIRYIVTNILSMVKDDITDLIYQCLNVIETIHIRIVSII